MPGKPQLKFSQHFNGTIWTTMAVPERDTLIVEVRDDKNFQVHFSALDFRQDKFLWHDIKLKESWWIGLTAANQSIILFHTYINKGNPDHKNLIAFNIFDQTLRWEQEDFSFFDWNETEIRGYRTKDDLVKATINIESGLLTEQEWATGEIQQKSSSIRPVWYAEGTAYFETVKKFIQHRANSRPSKGLEYLEWREYVLVSFYVEDAGSLANYLLVANQEGEVLLEVKMGEKLTGLGTDTFFILEGCLFLIKNKSELAAYVL